jgi:hypothetical protein
MDKSTKILIIFSVIYLLILGFTEFSKNHYKHNHTNMCEGSGVLAKH